MTTGIACGKTLKDMWIKHAIFDFDGTLFDTLGVWDTVGERYLRSLRRKPQQQGLGKALPNKIPMGQNERTANYGTSVESCSYTAAFRCG